MDAHVGWMRVLNLIISAIAYNEKAVARVQILTYIATHIRKKKKTVSEKVSL